MVRWTRDELASAKQSGELYISIANEDGILHKPTFIWGVVADDELYCRGYNGEDAAWYRAAIREKKGLITIGDIMNRAVKFEFINNGAINKIVDKAYKTQFKGSEYLEDILTNKAQSATVKIIPE